MDSKKRLLAKKMQKAQQRQKISKELAAAVKIGDTDRLMKADKTDLVQMILDMAQKNSRVGNCLEKYDERDFQLTMALINKTSDLEVLKAKYQEDFARLVFKNKELEKQLQMKYPGGRAPQYSDEFKEQVRQFYRAGGQTYNSTAAHFEISKSTVGRILRDR